MKRYILAHAKLCFSPHVTILDAVVAVLLMEASLNGCGKLMDKMNALHTTFAEQPEKEYEGHGRCMYFLRFNYSYSVTVHLVLDWLNLSELRDRELERIAQEYDQSKPWTENDQNEKRTMPREFKRPHTPPVYPSQSATTNNGFKLLSTQIAHQEKREEIKSNQHTEQYSTPLTVKPPVFNR